MIHIGIDPSINSTGITIFANDSYKYFIIKPNHLTKKEQEADSILENFNYIIYNKADTSQCADNIEAETMKTRNMIQLVDVIKEIVTRYNEPISVVIEGISYGSCVRTRSVFDLAGLNFMIRTMILDIENAQLIVAPPSVIKKFATGNGNCNKDAIINLFSIMEPEIVKYIKKADDLADSYFMAQFGKSAECK